MFTFATTATAVLGSAVVDCSSSSALYGAPCTDDNCGIETDSGTVNDSGGAQPSYGLADATFIEDSGSPDAADASFIDDSGDAGEDAD